jgi:alpha/beta superfamily hydrolase
MKFPENTKAYVWGAAIGAITVAVVGFSWGGWMTGAGANKEASSRAHDAVVAALAPICAQAFRAQADVTAKTAELVKVSSWERGTMMEKSGFATMPGSKTADPNVARACAEILATPPKA